MVILTAVLAFLAAMALTGYIVTKRHPDRVEHEKTFAIAFVVLAILLIGVLAVAFYAGWRGW